MNRDIFRRHTRFSHEFGTLEQRNDPLGSRTFDPRFPERVDQLSASPASPPLEVQQHGERRWASERSGVEKPAGGMATLEGPDPFKDSAFAVAVPVPWSTKQRKSGVRSG